MNERQIYTIGHSNHSIGFFLELLSEFKINCIVDVRSVAASTFNPQFNKDSLSRELNANHIQYLHMPEEFGARQSNPAVLDEEGKVDFEKVRQSSIFKNGIERIWQGVRKGYTIALMCSESEPFDCHRFSMISNALEAEGISVNHILKDKTIRKNADLENQLLKKYRAVLPQADIFSPNVTSGDQITIAYKLRNKEIAYSPQ